MEWTQQLVAQQKQRTERIRKETENIKAILDAERGKNVEAIRTAQHIEQEEGRSNITRIRNEVITMTMVCSVYGIDPLRREGLKYRLIYE